jgi:hypothetical protein
MTVVQLDQVAPHSQLRQLFAITHSVPSIQKPIFLSHRVSPSP